MNTVIVGVGSNIQPDSTIKQARTILSHEHQVIKESAFVATAPIGFTDQPDFVNGAFFVETDMDLPGFENYLKEVENRLGRVRTGNKFGPRTIDLDIIVWNGRVVSDDYATRDFVKKAVDELID
jgi:2-amino-4-hydroxy-6-hydroxymethyldihydropteridine diphosphokinase